MLLICCIVEDTSLSAIVLVSHRTEQFILYVAMRADAKGTLIYRASGKSFLLLFSRVLLNPNGPKNRNLKEVYFDLQAKIKYFGDSCLWSFGPLALKKS